MSRTVTTAVIAAVLVATVGVGLGAVPPSTAAADSTNSPPVADAGDDRTVDEKTTVRLDASESTDPDGDIVTHNWTQTDGPPVALSNRYATSPTFTAPAVTSPTTLTFQTTARDGDGGRDTDTVTVTVIPTNDPPTADAGADRRVTAAATVELDAGGSTDANGDALTYTWRQVAGAGVTLVDTGTATTSFTVPPVDSSIHLVFEVRATDGDGASDTDTVNVTVMPADVSTYTRDEIAQAMYDHDFDDLSTESAREIEELYLRQPLPAETDPADLQTREALARERHGESFDSLGRAATVSVQSAYDAQFGESEAAAYTRDDITQAKYDYDFADVSAETAGEMEALYDRQPFAGSSPDEIRTREELSATTYGVDHDDLSRDSRLTIERLYHAQFGVTASPANFSVVALSATEAPAGTETVHVTARITNHGSTTATQSVELRLDRDGDETLDDEALANESLTLDSGATAQVNFTAPLDAFETGTSRYGVATANDSRRATLDDGTLAAATTEDDPYTGGVGTENVTDDTESEGPVSAPEMRDGEAVVDLSALRANHRYEVDLGDDVTANGVTVTGQELMLVRSDDGGGLRVAASKTAMDDAPALTGTFAYLRVEAAGLADEDIMEVDFVFRVSPSRLNETGVDPNDVRLYRYHDGEWESYETIHRGDGRFESGDVPGFSVFAVGPTGASAMTAASAEGERETETPTPTASPTPTETSDAEVTTTAPATDASTGTPAATAVTTSRSTTSSRTPGFTPVTVLAALVGSVFLIRRLRARR